MGSVGGAAVSVGWTFACAIAMTGAVVVARPDDHVIVDHRLGATAPPMSARRVVMALAGATIVTVLSIVPSTATRWAVVACAAGGWFGCRLHRVSAERAAARDFGAEAARLVGALSSEIRAGVIPVVAVQTVAADASDTWTALRRISASDVPMTFRRLAEVPGGRGLITAAAAWEVADRAGAPLATLLSRVAEGIQDDIEMDREIAMEAAPARATGTLMAVLPVVGVLLGAMLGADPVHVLFATGPGLACLVVGLALACAGLWWIDHIVQSAADP
jgi:tight adherence protein B